jgi:hypothetical protein
MLVPRLPGFPFPLLDLTTDTACFSSLSFNFHAIRGRGCGQCGWQRSHGPASCLRVDLSRRRAWVALLPTRDSGGATATPRSWHAGRISPRVVEIAATKISDHGERARSGCGILSSGAANGLLWTTTSGRLRGGRAFALAGSGAPAGDRMRRKAEAGDGLSVNDSVRPPAVTDPKRSLSLSREAQASDLPCGSTPSMSPALSAADSSQPVPGRRPLRCRRLQALPQSRAVRYPAEDRRETAGGLSSAGKRGPHPRAARTRAAAWWRACRGRP